MPKLQASKAVVVARVSSEEQNTERQLLDIQDYVDKYGFEVVAPPQELKESGYKLNRKDFQKALETVKEVGRRLGEKVAFIFSEGDRPTRQVMADETIEIIDLIKEGKIELHFASDEKAYDQNSPLTELKQRFLDAEKESEHKSKRVMSARRLSIAKKEFRGFTPTGYVNAYSTGVDGRPEKKILIDRKRAKYIQIAFQKYADEHTSLQELAIELRNMGFTMKPRPGHEPKPVTKSDLQRLLKNSFYIGKPVVLDPDKRDEKGTRVSTMIKATNYQPIVDETTFKQVQKKFERRAIRFKTRHSTVAPHKYRKLIECGYCGCFLTVEQRDKERFYLRCSYGKKAVNQNWYQEKYPDKTNVSSRRKRIKDKAGRYVYTEKKHKIYNCPQRWHKEQEIDGAVQNILNDMEWDNKAFNDLKKYMTSQFRTDLELSQQALKQIDKNIAKKEKTLSGLVQQIPEDLKKKHKSLIDAEINKIEQEIEDLKEMRRKEDKEKVLITGENIENIRFVGTLMKQFAKLSDIKKRSFLRLAFDEIFAFNNYKDAQDMNQYFDKWEKKLPEDRLPEIITPDGLVFVLTERFNALFDAGIAKFPDAKATRGKGGEIIYMPAGVVSIVGKEFTKTIKMVQKTVTTSFFYCLNTDASKRRLSVHLPWLISRWHLHG